MIPLTLDTETAPIRPGTQAPELACVALQSRGLGIRELLHWSDYKKAVRWALENPDVLIVGHTIAYDMLVLMADDAEFRSLIFAAYNADRVVCTEIRAKLLDIATGQRKFYQDEAEGGVKRSGYSLDALAQRHLGRALDKNTWRLSYGDLRRCPLAQWPDGARLYPLEDTRATEDLFYTQESYPEYLLDQFRQSRAAFWIKVMSAWGLRTDAQGVWELSERTKQEYDRIAADLREVGLLRPDKRIKRRSGIVETEPGARNVKAVGNRVIAAYTSMGKEYPQTKGGGPCTDSQTCEDSGDPILIQYSEFSSLAKTISTDIPLLERGIREPLHAYFDTLKDTGRTSSKPNVQNPPRKGGIRECFVPRCLNCSWVHGPDDYAARVCLGCGACLTVYISCDYGKAELCTLAQVCITHLKWSTLADALNNGVDPHLVIASQLLNGAPCDLLERIHETQTAEAGITWDDVDNARQSGKVANFGNPGGLGADAFVHFALANYGVRVTVDRARELKRVWLATWPEMKDYFRFINYHTSSPTPRITQLFSGRIRGFSGPRAYTEACNTMFQGLAADMAKAAGWMIVQACFDPDSPLYGCRIVNFIHDEFILEAPEARAHEAALELSRLMILAAKDWIPDVKIAAKPQIMRRYSKKAKPVWKDGRLVPWDRAA